MTSTTQDSVMNNSNSLRPSWKGPKLSLLDLQTEQARRRFYEFVRQGWHVLEPNAPFVDGIHVHAICEHLHAVTEGRISNLLINVPPGHAKSLLGAVFWPAWVWIDRPHVRFLFASYSGKLSERDSVRCRRLIESEWYQRRWGNRYQLACDQNQKSRFENDHTGYRIATSVGGTATGERADIVVVDDPHSVDQAESDTERRTAVEWFGSTMCTRLNDLATGHKVVIQQRLHENDVTGDLLAKGGFELLCLPAEFEPERRCTTSIGWTDPRSEPGELLWPEKIARAQLDALKVWLGSYRYAGQYQQRPSPADGGIFKRAWFRFWRPAHMDLSPVSVRWPDGSVVALPAVPIPAEFDTMIQSWDMTFKDKATSDYVVGQLWGARGAHRFLIDQERARLDMPATKEAVRSLSARWPKATVKLIEDKANGPAVIQELGHEIEGLIAVTPEGGKIGRAHAVSPIVESGNVYLPHPAIAGWVNGFLEETTVFPNGRHDDQVDAMTQALNRLRHSQGMFQVPETQIVIDPFAIPEEWPRGYGIAIEPTGVGAVWGARDPGGMIYLYAEHQSSHGEPSENARAIKVVGDWIPGVLSTASVRGSQTKRSWIAELYREQGLVICMTSEAEEAAAFRFWKLLATGKLRVFASQSGLLNVYRIGDETALLLRCCAALVAGSEYMKTKPKPRPHEYRLDMPWGPNAWMAA